MIRILQKLRLGLMSAWLRRKAESRAWLRPPGLYPGHTFSAGWDDPDPKFRARRAIWDEFSRRGLDERIKFPWHHGLRLLLNMGNDLSRQLYINGCADPNELYFLDRFLKPGMVVVDCGANCGFYTLFAARQVGDEGLVLAFEPSSREFARLTANVAHNRLANVRCYRSALGACDGVSELKIAGQEHDGQNTFGNFVHQGISLSGAERVSIQRLDTAVEQAGLRRLDFLKLDVEGAETAVLNGATGSIARFRPLVLAELQDASLRTQGSSAAELLTLFRRMDYRFYGFGTDGRPSATETPISLNIIATPTERPLHEP